MTDNDLANDTLLIYTKTLDSDDDDGDGVGHFTLY